MKNLFFTAALLVLNPLQVLAAAEPQAPAPQAAAPEKENALTYLQQARAGFKRYAYVEKNGKKEPDVRRVVEDHAAVFALLERAAALPLRFEKGGPDPTSAQGKVSTSMREAARLLRMRATVQQEAGDSAGALRSGLLCVALGTKMQEDGAMMASLTGYDVEEIGLRSITDLAPKWDAVTLKAAARGLGEAEAKRPPFARVLAEDLEMSQQETRRMFQEDAPMFGGFDFDDMRDRLLTATREVAEEDNALIDRPFALTRGLGADFKRDIADALEEEDEDDLPEPPANGADFDARALAEAMQKVVRSLKYTALFNRTRTQASLALLQTALAARAYRLEHGAFPKSLQVLAPEYLQSVPKDPFDVGAPVRLKSDADGFRIYSVGPDGFDDGGRPTESKNEDGKPTPRPIVGAKSVGDILAPAELLAF